MNGWWWKILSGLLLLAAIPIIFLHVGPADGFTMNGQGAKIIFFHVPCAWLASLAYVVAAWNAIKYLKKRSLDDDDKCAASMELGLLFGIAATVTGSIFSHNEWGRYWSMDPRQTSILIILLIFAAYLVLRGSITEQRKRALLCSVYALAALPPAIFLIWVLPRVVETLHGFANQAVVGGELSGNYRLVLYGLCLPGFLGLFAWMFQLRVISLRLFRNIDR
jgi:heme exporter protein C